ncbi:asparagine synthase-related protein [Rhodothalassium salexigens]|uniref:asparagine synthase-related protein n=1 Tax=Rhodothalassium salexigens TaxID=1086 RepID=UPI00191209C0
MAYPAIHLCCLTGRFAATALPPAVEAVGRPFHAEAADEWGGQSVAGDDGLVVALTGAPWARHKPGPMAAADLLAAVRAKGERALEDLNGAFVAMVHDRARGRTVVMGDRAGVIPLFWTEGAAGAFGASTRLADLAGLGADRAALDPTGLLHYLFYFSVPGPGTIYRGIARLRPGHRLVATADGVTEEAYWRLPYSADGADRDLAGLHERMRAVLDQGVARALDVAVPGPVGSFLSGGLDSSAVTGLAAGRRPGIASFTVRFREPAFDEGPYARIAADHFRTDHHEVYVDPPDVVDLVEKMAANLNQPFGNTSAIAAYYAVTAARSAGMTTLLAGDGGDELFAGNAHYLDLQRPDVYGRIPTPLRRLLLDPVLAWRALDRLPGLGKAHRLQRRYYLSLAQRKFADYDPFRHFGLAGVLNPDIVAEVAGTDPVRLAEEAFAAAAHTADPIQQMMAMDMQLTVADNDLIKVNEMCALAGVAVRYPMLDEDVMQFAADLPGDVLVPRGRLRGFFKDAFKGFLPDPILTKTKQGFGLPFPAWIQTDQDLRTCLLDALVDLRQRGLFTAAYLDDLERACRGTQRYLDPGNAWDAAVLELWMRHHRISV